ncbi:MAG: hypothetical protein IMZ69_05815 [Spirochaetes bacterium]|nr:hypothetical protein [Spirochaetota bacterium]
MLSTDLRLAVEVRVTNSMREVPVLDRIHFGRAELTALYLRLNAELAKRK